MTESANERPPVLPVGSAEQVLRGPALRAGGRARAWLLRSGQAVASVGLAVALLGLTGVATWSAFSTSAAAQSSQTAGTVADGYAAARFAVGQEESLERKYRLEPAADVRAAHRAAKDAVDAAMRTVLAHGDAADRAVARDVLGRNAGYYRASLDLLAAADRRDVPAQTAIDHHETDPVFGDMQSIVYAQADRHRLTDAAAQARLMRMEAIARWATALAVGVGVLLIGLFYRVRRRHNRDSAAAAALTAHQAAHDGLTGLPNRGQFTALLQAALAEAEPGRGSVGVVLVDLDRFKEINDTLGHAYGDELLRQVGPRLRGVLRAGQVIARLGGDEFALLVPTAASGEPAVAEQQAVVTRILDALCEPFLVDGVRLAVEASAGIAVSGVHGGGAEVLVQRADIAMYQAKTTHQRLAVYDHVLDEHHPRKLALLAALREAIGTDQLQLHFQPLVDLDSGAVHGAEALLRWQHPVEGLLPPAEFIPLAEGCGLIHDLTTHVLQLACTQARTWQRAGTPLTVSVNISARCLLDAALPDAVAATLARTGLPARLLILEITESAIIADPVRAQDVIDRLAALGVGLSIDDFGTGYTSLSYLRDLPVTELKIDRSFVLRMLTDPKDAVIVRTGVELAARLGLTSVAEGIEDAATLTALRALGCSTAQGYHIARPMPADAFTAWHAARGGLPSAAPATAPR